jgi:hypothetical protein
MVYLVLIALLVLPAVAGLVYLAAGAYRSLTHPVTTESESDRVNRLLSDADKEFLEFIKSAGVSQGLGNGQYSGSDAGSPYQSAFTGASGSSGNVGTVTIGSSTGGTGGTGDSFAKTMVGVLDDMKPATSTLQEQIAQIEGTQLLQQSLINDLKNTEEQFRQLLQAHLAQYAADNYQKGLNASGFTKKYENAVKEAATAATARRKSAFVWGGQVIPPGHNGAFKQKTKKKPSVTVSKKKR